MRTLPEGTLYIDTHDALVAEPVWSLYQYTIEVIGERPTLIEWDNDIPDFPVLMQEAAKAQTRMTRYHSHAA